MAGGFGFEKDKYRISQEIGELELLPAVRETPRHWLVIADGFSCREQIAQGSDRHALHLAEVIQMALNGELVDTCAYPEAERVDRRRAQIQHSMKRAAITTAGVAAGGALLWSLVRKR